jgi:hypothetical protein
MKKLIVWTLALVFSLTVSFAFADKKPAPPPVGPVPGAIDPMAKEKKEEKNKDTKEKKKGKKGKKEEKKDEKKEEKK